jgi:hypothetical protein
MSDEALELFVDRQMAASTAYAKALVDVHQRDNADDGDGVREQPENRDSGVGIAVAHACVSG